MAQRRDQLLFVSLVTVACCLQACAEGLQKREDVNRPRDNPFPPVALTSSDPQAEEPDSALDWSVPLVSHPVAVHETPADAGAPPDEADAAASDAGDAGDAGF